jgi:hypothetical protein
MDIWADMNRDEAVTSHKQQGTFSDAISSKETT